MELFDISLPLNAALASWPGDLLFAFRLNAEMSAGATVNVGAVTMGVHNGSHADAPFHFLSNGCTIDEMPLEPFFGPATVIDCTEVAGEIKPEDLQPRGSGLTTPPRLLVKTGMWRNHSVFPTTIPVLSAGAIAWLGEQKVRLLGIDLPSIDAIESKTLPNHHALATLGICIVESLDLAGVAAGSYNLAALPLKIAGGDAAPVRAILWR